MRGKDKTLATIVVAREGDTRGCRLSYLFSDLISLTSLPSTSPRLV